MKIIIAQANCKGLLKMADAVLERYGKHDVPAKIKGQATLAALKEMTGVDKFFSVCAVERLAQLNNVFISSEHQAFFQSLHCVHWENMHEDTREYLYAILVNYFRKEIAAVDLLEGLSNETN